MCDKEIFVCISFIILLVYRNKQFYIVGKSTAKGIGKWNLYLTLSITVNCKYPTYEKRNSRVAIKASDQPGSKSQAGLLYEC